MVKENQRDPGSYYLKGKWRHWFWPAAVYSPLIAAIQPLFIGIRIFDMPAWELIAINSATTAVWMFLLMIYGLKNNVKAYKAAFIVLAAVSFSGLVLNAFITLFPHLQTSLSLPLV